MEVTQGALQPWNVLIVSTISVAYVRLGQSWYPLGYMLAIHSTARSSSDMLSLIRTHAKVLCWCQGNLHTRQRRNIDADVHISPQSFTRRLCENATSHVSIALLELNPVFFSGSASPLVRNASEPSQRHRIISTRILTERAICVL